MQPLRIYLIGAGVVAYTHAATLGLLPVDEQVILSVADPNPQALESFLRAHPQARPFADAQEMLAEPANERDIVIVAAPPYVHCELTCAALRTGRHVLCEKPFAMNMQEAVQMLRVAREEGRVLGCCSSRSRGSSIGQVIRTMLDEHVLGKLYHMRFIDCTQRYRPGIEQQPESRWFLQQALSGGGVLMNLGTYDLSFLNELLAPERVDVLSAWMANPTFTPLLIDGMVADVEQHIGAAMRYHLSDGSAVALTYERAACTYGEPYTSMEIVGTLGALRWDWFMWQATARLVHTVERDGDVFSQEQRFTFDGNLMPTMYKPLYHFYQYLQDQPSPAVINEHAVFNFACLQAIYQCALSNTRQSIVLEQFSE